MNVATRSKILFSLANRRRGFSIIEIIIGYGLVMMGVATLITYMSSSYSTVNRGGLTQLAQEVELQILNSLQSSEFLADKSEQLRQGNVPTPFDITSTIGALWARHNVEIGIYADGRQCTTPELTDCDLITSLSIRCTREGSYYDCRAAYNVRYNQNALSGSSIGGLAELGVERPFSDNPNSKYIVPLSYDIFSNTQKTCEAGSTIVTGYDSVNGVLHCASMPTTPCSPGQVSTGIGYLADAAGGGEITMSCLAPRTVACPANYSLHTVQQAALDPRSTASKGQCVFAAANTAPWTVTPKAEGLISGRFCPDNYEVTGVSCVVANPATDITSGQGYCAPGPANDANLTAYSISVSTSGPNATCEVIYGPQLCGAWIRVQVTMSGSCQRAAAIPETVEAL